MVTDLTVSAYQRLGEALVTAIVEGEHSDLDEIGEAIATVLNHSEDGTHLVATLLGVEDDRAFQWQEQILHDQELEEDQY